MAITMYQSDRAPVSPSNDASLYSGIVNDTNGVLNRGNKFYTTVNGLIATVGTGQAVIQGRLVEIISPETVTLPSNSTGKIVLVVDLTRQNDVYGQAGDADYSVKVNQAYVAVVTGTVVQDDLNNGGYMYELPIASFVSTDLSATVSIINSTFNDTGWLDLSLPTGANNNNGKGFAQYRIKNGEVILNLYNINISGTSGGNQLLTLPVELLPDSAHSQFFTVSNLNTDNNYTNSVLITVPSRSVGGTLWARTAPNPNAGLSKMIGITGTIIYLI